MGLFVISLRTPRSTGENFGCTWEHLGAPAISLGAPRVLLGAPTTSLGAPGSTLNDCNDDWENDIFFGNVAGAPGNHTYY